MRSSPTSAMSPKTATHERRIRPAGRNRDAVAVISFGDGLSCWKCGNPVAQVLLNLCLEDRSRRDSLFLFGAELKWSANQTVHVLNRCNRSIAAIFLTADHVKANLSY
jgi:hypothetical protein